MATANRKPLANRHAYPPPSPGKSHRGHAKRGRSPDYNELNVPKRLRHAEREQRELEFKEKYSRAFPTFNFYLDKENMLLDAPLIKVLETRIRSLGGVIEDFFSKQITHLITDQPASSSAAEKENITKNKTILASRHNPHISPMKLKKSTMEDVSTGGFDLVAKANSFGIKIWNTNKLESVISRCLDVPSSSTLSMQKPSMTQPSAGLAPQRSLSRLLQSERILGTTERDPTQKRHGFRYFSRGSYFILVEDLRQELATIAAHEYVLKKGKNDLNNPPWPVLHCHPKSRSPFIPFDDREKRRWERIQSAEKAREVDQAVTVKTNNSSSAVAKEKVVSRISSKAGDLRRTVSLSNFQRRASLPISMPHKNLVDLDADRDEDESANASGYLASGAAAYVAASGNSVGITSATGTTSTTGHSFRYFQLPSALTERMRQQIVTSCKFPVASNSKVTDHHNSRSMAPPALPEKQPMLKKSKSTNTIKLPKREEGSKPGYCESCRTKFEDFKDHINSRRHRSFALNDANFLQLDCVLARVQRRTRKELEHQERERKQRHRQYCCRQ